MEKLEIKTRRVIDMAATFLGLQVGEKRAVSIFRLGAESLRSAGAKMNKSGKGRWSVHKIDHETYSVERLA